jgi:hypothetical protein
MKRKNSKYIGYGSYKSDIDERESKKYRPSRFAKYGAIAGAIGGSSGVSAAAYGASDMWAAALPYLPALEEAAGGAIMADLLVPVAMGGAVAAGAVAATAAVGYLVGTAIESMFAQNNSESSVIQSLMPGVYQGKFAFSNKSFKGLRDKFQKKGGVFIYETFGAVADPDIVYVGQSSWNQGCATTAIGYALLRKLFRIGCKIDIMNPYEILPLGDILPQSGNDCFSIIYSCRDSNGTLTTYEHVIPVNSSLESLQTLNLNGFILRDSLIDALINPNPNNIVKVSLYMNPGGVARRLVTCLDMGKEVLEVAMSSHMVIQNRTKSVTGSTSTDLIDVQPLKGPVFQFSSGVPKLKDDSPIVLNEITDNGIILLRVGQFPVIDGNGYKEPPVRAAFQGVTKSGYVRLNPGALKSMTIGADIKGYYSNVLFKLRYNLEAARTARCYGKSQMVVLEEELNSGSANNLTISYECQHIAGAEFITTSNPNMQPGYFAGEVNNLPA